MIVTVPGARVFLRRPTAGDALEFVARVRRSRRLHRPWIYAPSTTRAFAAHLARSRQANRQSWLVCRREDGALVGVVNVAEIVRGALQSAYLGYYALAPHAGQGYMREGVALAIRHAFGVLGLHRLEANIQPENRRSVALVRALGFRREGFSPRYLKVGGRWRDHERWALLRERWAGGPRPWIRPAGRMMGGSSGAAGCSGDRWRGVRSDGHPRRGVDQ